MNIHGLTRAVDAAIREARQPGRPQEARPEPLGARWWGFPRPPIGGYWGMELRPGEVEIVALCRGIRHAG